MKNNNVVIIGAGPAGLSAAYELINRTQIKPLILESTDAIGGISRTIHYHGNRIDIGGHRFFSKNNEVLKIWEELMPVQGALAWDDRLLNRNQMCSIDGPDPEKVDAVMLVRNRVSRIYFLNKFFNYPISLNIDTISKMGFVRTFIVGIGYIYSVIFKRKENNLEDFYINRFGKPLYQMFFENYTEKLWGIHPSEIAPDWGAQRVKGLSLFKAVFSLILNALHITNNVETSLIESFHYPKYGPGQLWEKMAEKIIQSGGEIRKNCVVNSITFKEDGTFKIGFIEDGDLKSVDSDSVFSSMPIKDFMQSITNAKPQNVKEVAEALPYRDFITVGILANKLQIKNNTKIPTISNIVPDCWIYIQDRSVKIGRLQIFNNWSPYMVKNPQENVWIGLEYFCSEGDELWNMPENEFIDFAIQELVKIDVIKSDDILDSTCIKVKKAYPAYFGTYKEFSLVKDYLNQIPNLFFIGRNGQHRYNNMDHSMLTSIEAVNCYINNSDKDIIWNVNTEKNYHESK